MDKQLQENMPIYMQIMQKVREAIASGELAPGVRVASVREFAGVFAVNPNTMQRALTQLEQDGLLISKGTAGRFVTEDQEILRAARQNAADELIESFLQGCRQMGFGKDEIIQMLKDKEGIL